jgi:hypothetical protein
MPSPEFQENGTVPSEKGASHKDNMPRIPALYDALRLATEDLISALKADEEHSEAMHRSIVDACVGRFMLDDDEQWALRQQSSRLEDNGTWTMQRPHSTLHSYLLRARHIECILSSAATRRVYDILLDAGHIEKSPFVDAEGNEVDDCSAESLCYWVEGRQAGVVEFVKRYVGKIPSLDFEETVFGECYADFENYHLSDEVPCRSTIPLMNFSSDVESIKFDESVSILRLPPGELNRLASNMEHCGIAANVVGLSTVGRIFDERFAVIVDFRVEKAAGYVPPKISAAGTAEQVLTAVRLIKPGNVHANLKFSEVTGFHPRSLGLMMGHTHPLVPNVRSEALHLSREEVPRCVEVWRQLRTISREDAITPLDIAIRKLTDLCDRWKLEDRIIDMAIILETTLLRDVREELRYRLSLRGTRLLRASRAPQETAQLLKDFYDVRSQIVHAGKTLEECKAIKRRECPPADFVQDMELVCREVLATFVERVAAGESVGDIVASLDEEALST